MLKLKLPTNVLSYLRQPTRGTKVENPKNASKSRSKFALNTCLSLPQGCLKAPQGCLKVPQSCLNLHQKWGVVGS